MENLKKIIAIIILLTLIISFNSTIVIAITEEIENNKEVEETNTEPVGEDSEDVIEESIEENEEVKENEEIEYKETQAINEEIKKQTELSRELYSNTEFKGSIIVRDYTINTYLKNGIYYLFIPKEIDISQLQIHYEYKTGIKETSAGIIDAENKIIINDFTNADTITIMAEDGSKYKIKVMQSDVPSICINLKDVDLKTVTSGSKDTKYEATLQIAGAEEEKYNLSDNSIEIKGRGNTTWGLAKKPYQIKLNKKQNLLGIGSGKSKKWILLANQLDRTLLKNKLMCDLQKEVGLSQNLNSEFIDLYINGEYQGNYLLCEKVEIGENRVNLTNSKGILAEIDSAYGWKEPLYFRTRVSNEIVALKESYAVEENDDTELEKLAFKEFQNYVGNFENQIYAENPNWSKISKMIDVDSFVKYYILTELAEDPDRFISSTFIWRDGPDDVLHIGPLWDNDTALGYHDSIMAGAGTDTDYNLNTLKYRTHINWMTQLYRNKEFARLINKEYQNNVEVIYGTIINRLDQYVEKTKKSVDMNYVIWGNLLTRPGELVTAHPCQGSYEGEVNYLKKWLFNRVNYMNNRYGSDYQVSYNTNVKGEDWQDNWKLDGGTSGTTGQAKPIEQIKIVMPNMDGNKSLEYNVHSENIGWTGWKQEANVAGVEGLKIEAIEIKLKNMEDYTISYRVHVTDIGWMPWMKNGETAGTVGLNKGIEAIEIKVEKSKGIGNKEENENSLISYSGHISHIGWTNYGSDTEMIGTVGQCEQMEAIKIKANKNIFDDLELTYQVHVEDYGWMDWKDEDEIAGTEGEGKRIEAIKIKVNNSGKYKVSYRVHVQDIGWMDWKNNGEEAGTTGQRKRVEAIEIKLEQKEFYGKADYDPETDLTYEAHIANHGWTEKGENGEIIGTQTIAKQIEAIKINLKQDLTTDVWYRVYVADKGWLEWKKNGEIAGTEGEGRRIEAFQIKLSSTAKHDIKYRAYVANIGWMPWRQNGEIAGTTGQALQLESMQIRLEKNN